MKRILMTGDSITDSGRNREALYDLGNGYPILIGSGLGYDYPGEYEFINKGISGNRSVDILARIKQDCINLKPDYISILMGINDVWHEINYQNGVETKKFEKIYDMIVEEILEALPSVKVFLLQPFVTHGTATDDNYELFCQGAKEKAEATARIAAKYNLPVIDLQAEFDHAQEKAPATVWTGDGVHPTPAGHQVIARAWRRTFETMTK